MVNRKYVLGIAIVLFLCLALASNASANPNIGSPTNNKTSNASLAFTVNEDETVKFSIGTWNETTNVTWNWYLNNTPSGGNNPNFTYTFSNGDKKIKVNLTNLTTDNTSNTITWDITAQSLPSKPHITGWRNNITNGTSLNITINLSDTVKFNATANQTISIWNWSVDSINKQSTASDTYTYQFNIAGNPKIKVEAVNANGTSDNNIQWNVSVEDNNPPANITQLKNKTGPTWINWTWTNPSDSDHTEVLLDNNSPKPNTNFSYYNDTGLDPKTTHSISLKPVDASGNKGNYTHGTASTDAEKPIITRISPTKSKFVSGIETTTFQIQLTNLPANVTWTWPGDSYTNKSVSIGDDVYFNFTPSGPGSYNISVSAYNAENGTSSDTISWIMTVHPATFSTGNRIWDGSKPDEFDLTYSWTPQSFSGFYYNAKDNVGTENITIDMKSYTSTTIEKGKLTYSTTPQDVSFTYSGFGKYQVIGFMAEKYFAGYTDKTTPPNTKPSTNFDGISTVEQNQLHKVLIDDEIKRTISVGGTIALKEGYVLKAKDIDLNARQMLLSLLKDGNEVDVSPLSAGETYVYSKTVGDVDNLPLIIVRFDSVFSGQETQAAFLKGMFQISEDATKVETGNQFGNMEVISANKDGIRMENSGTIGLSKGTTASIMGDMKIIVANNASVVRFALSVEKTGDFEVRSTAYLNSTPIMKWTPYNFGMNIGKTSIGFFYDLDDGIGNETLRLLNNVSGRSIPDQGLEYSTTPQEVNFIYTGFGKYQVIGFMADKYFAGYTSNSKPPDPTTNLGEISTLANNNLHKVLIDDDTKRTISVGGTIALKEGYVLKATDIDLKGRTMLLSLLKDGSEVDTTPLSAGQTYVYAKKVGNTDNLPLIMVRFETVFSGEEVQAAFLKGMFQISDNPITVESGDKFGKMDVTGVTKNEITMSNDGTISLDKNKNDVLMGNLKLKVADNEALRFYWAVDVTANMIENQLLIDAPAKAMAGDNLNIKVTAGGKAAENASLTLDTDMGTTNMNGSLNYSIPKTLKNGTYTITATKTGYEKATKTIEIEKYVDYRLSIEAPSNANQYETIKIKVLYNGTAMSGASVIFDNTSIGSTDSNGEVNYKLETSGTHSITASKQSYIMVSRDIEIRAPYSEFKALDINITPNPVFTSEDFVVKSNITNVGTKSDTIPVELIINGSTVENRSVTLVAGEKVEINFTRNEEMAKNITVGILGQSNLLIVQQKPTNYLLIAAIATGIGAVIIYVLTSKGLLSLELLKQKFGLLSQKFNLLFKK